MKKITILLTMTIVMICCLTGCGGRDPYAGKWEASELVVNNTPLTDLGGIPLSALVRFELDKSGSAKWESPMTGIKDPSKDGVSARWKVKDGNLIMKISVPDEETKTVTLEPRDGKLVMTESGTEIHLVSVDEFTPVDDDTMSQLYNLYNFSILMGDS